MLATGNILGNFKLVLACSWPKLCGLSDGNTLLSAWYDARPPYVNQFLVLYGHWKFAEPVIDLEDHYGSSALLLFMEGGRLGYPLLKGGRVPSRV